MSNSWKYSNLGQRERLKLIRSGNSDVYKSEKQNNASLKKARQQLGLSTDEVDRWDKLVDSANAAANDPYKVKNNGLPKFQSSRVSSINNAMNKELNALSREYNNALNEAKKDAENEINYTSEWLINNGYSQKGDTFIESVEDIEEALKQILAELSDKYRKESESIRNKFYSLLEASRKK